MPVKEASSTRGRHNDKGNLEHEKWAGPWEVSVIIQQGLSLDISWKVDKFIAAE